MRLQFGAVDNQRVDMTTHNGAQKVPVLGIPITVADYQAVVDFVLNAARNRESRTISALAVHGLMTGVLDRRHGRRLADFDMLVPDGQPVRWGLNWLSRGSRLRDRVYGPELTLRICDAASLRGVGVYLFGSRPGVVTQMAERLTCTFPLLRIVGVQPSRFREATAEEDAADTQRINQSGAGIVFVGLGCPRQEKWVWEHRGRVKAAMVCVGAAFDFHAGNKPQAPEWMQRRGLEWFFRLMSEPWRLWARYLLLNPTYLALLALQCSRLWNPGGRHDESPPTKRDTSDRRVSHGPTR